MPAEPLGLIAGNGTFPLLFARAARRQGVPVVAVALEGQTTAALDAEVDVLGWARVGQLGRMIDFLRRRGVSRAAFAGGVGAGARMFGAARPDLRGLAFLARYAVRRDDSMLRAVAREFERAGIRIVDSLALMPEALTPAGVLTARAPTPAQRRDLAYGMALAQAVGRLDVGQTVVVRRGAVVAVEAIEGTDACIRRAGQLTRGRDAVVVKVAKPTQDMRFDVPAVGLKTVTTLREAGISVLGLEAGRTLLLEPERLLAAAAESGLAVVGLEAAA